MANDLTYKAQFCRQYFVQLKQFVYSFNVSKDELGMKFLLDAYDYNNNITKINEWKNNCNWDNNIKADYGDKELMLSIEEYFSITNVHPYQHYQKELFEGLMDSDKYLSNDRVTSLFTDQETLFAILSHFGIPFPKGNDIIENQIKKFDDFAQIIAYGKPKLLFNSFNNALHLFQQCRNRNCHNIIIQEVPQRKIAFQFLAFMYIGLTFLLRMGWSIKENELIHKGYKKPDVFQIPEQELIIDVKVKDSSDDKIVRYEFVPNYKNGANRFSKDIEPTEKLRISHPVRKYDKFKLVITYRNSKSEEIKVFGDKGDKMLTYYYWRPTFEVILPEISNLQPGLTNSLSTEKLLAQLLDNATIQHTSNGTESSDVINALIAKLDPLFRKIDELSEGSKQQKSERDELVQKIDELIQKQNNHQKSCETIDDSVMKAIESLISYYERQEQKKKERRKKVQKYCSILTNFAMIFAVFLSLFTFVASITSNTNICWLKNYIWIILSAIALIVLYPVACYKNCSIASSIQKKIIKPNRFHVIGIIVIVVSLLGAYMAIPFKNKIDFIEKYDFLSMSDTDNKDAVKYMEECLANNNFSDDETLRSRLAEYYLYEHDYNQALRVTEPMRDVEKYRKGSFYAASALYHVDEFVMVTNILNWHEKVNNNELPLAYYRLKGILLAAGSKTNNVYTQDLKKGIELLRYAADKGDAEAQYYLGFVLSHDITNWNTKNDSVLAPYDLYEAVKYLRMAKQLPKSSFELANIFADLNMKDSARYYYLKAINSGVDSTIVVMASYRMGLFQEQWGIEKGDPDFLMKLKKDSYLPALLHDALVSNDMASAIARYIDINKKHGTVYKGYRYLSPLAFLYLANGEQEEALNTLKAVRPDEKFDLNFIHGLDSLLDPNLIGKNYEMKMMPMRLSAEQGSKYAEMICLYYDISRAIMNGDSTLSNIDRMDEIGKKIPFAHILKCHLFLTAKRYDQALKYADIALRQGHPVAALFIANCVAEGYQEHYKKDIFKDVKGDMRYDTYQLNMLEKAVRIAPNKRAHLWYISSIYDKKYHNQVLSRTSIEESERDFREQIHNDDIPKHTADSLLAVIKNMLLDASAKEEMSEQDFLDRLNFWYEVIIANHDLALECAMLPHIRDYYTEGIIKDLSSYLKLMSAAINDANEDSYEENLKTISILFCQLDKKPYFEMSFQDSIRNIYKNDKFRSELLSPNSKYRKIHGEIIAPGGSFEIAHWTLSPIEIFYECIGGGVYGKSITPEKFQFVDKEDYNLFAKPL